MKKATKNKIEFYNTLEIPLYNWDRFMATQDNNWFVVGYDGRQSKIDTPELTEAKNILMDEYFKAVDDQGFRNKLQKLAKIDHIKLKYNNVTVIVDRCYFGFTVDQEEDRYLNYKALKDWGLKVEYMVSHEDDKKQLDRVRTVLEGLETQLNILLSELKAGNVSQKKDLIDQLRMAQRALDYKFPLKIKDLSLRDWIGICKDMEELARKN